MVFTIKVNPLYFRKFSFPLQGIFGIVLAITKFKSQNVNNKSGDITQMKFQEKYLRFREILQEIFHYIQSICLL